MNKIILNKEDYTFDASAQTVTFSTDLEDITLNNLLLITNTTDNIIIYNFGCDGTGGSFSLNTLTLEYDTTLMSDDDNLQIVVYREKSPFETKALENSIEERILLETLTDILTELKKVSMYLENIAT